MTSYQMDDVMESRKLIHKPKVNSNKITVFSTVISSATAETSLRSKNLRISSSPLKTMHSSKNSNLLSVAHINTPAKVTSKAASSPKTTARSTTPTVSIDTIPSQMAYPSSNSTLLVGFIKSPETETNTVQSTTALPSPDNIDKIATTDNTTTPSNTSHSLNTTTILSTTITTGKATNPQRIDKSIQSGNSTTTQDIEATTVDSTTIDNIVLPTVQPTEDTPSMRVSTDDMPTASTKNTRTTKTITTSPSTTTSPPTEILITDIPTTFTESTKTSPPARFPSNDIIKTFTENFTTFPPTITSPLIRVPSAGPPTNSTTDSTTTTPTTTTATTSSSNASSSTTTSATTTTSPKTNPSTSTTGRVITPKLPSVGYCDAVSRWYPQDECRKWMIDVVFALDPWTSSDVKHQIWQFISTFGITCDNPTTMKFFYPSNQQWTGCPTGCRVGSKTCKTFAEGILRDDACIDSTDTNGTSVIDLFDLQLKCAYTPEYHQGGLLLFITNMECPQIQTQLQIVIAEQFKILQELYEMSYALYMVNFDNYGRSFRAIYEKLSRLRQSHDGECDVKDVFGTFNTFAHVINAPKELGLLALCPPRANDSKTTLVLVAVFVPLGCILLTASVIAFGCRQRRRFMAMLALRCDGMENPSFSGLNRSGNARMNRYTDMKKLKREDEWEIAQKDLIVHTDQILGKGAFAIVYKGTMKGPKPAAAINGRLSVAAEVSDTEVAVKTLPMYTDDDSRLDFFNEIDFMKQLGYHMHVVSLIGCSTEPEEPKIVLEYFANRDLLRYLRDHRDKYAPNKEDYGDVAGEYLDARDLISIAWQVCDGLCYMSARDYVHRDVAARNVLLTKDLVAKVGDFGLCRCLDQSLYTTKGGLLPIKWMAIESLKIYEYTTMSDVWSYGVFLFELFSLGDGPFPTVQPVDMIEFLESGQRNKRPDKCPDKIFQLMTQCWKADPSERPTFAELSTSLRALLRVDDESNDYLNLTEATYGYVQISGCRMQETMIN